MSTQNHFQTRPGQGCGIESTVLVWGAGPIAAFTALELRALGQNVLLLSPEKIVQGQNLSGGGGPDSEALFQRVMEDGNILVHQEARIEDFAGEPGRFYLKCRLDQGRVLERDVGAVILAQEPLLEDPLALWGLSPSERIVPLSRAGSDLPDVVSQEGAPLTAVILCGFTHLSHPFSQERAVQTAISLTGSGKNQVFFLVDHLKVALEGMEGLTRQAREAGVLFVKMTRGRPALEQRDGVLQVSFYDETLEQEVLIQPHLLVLEEAFRPTPETASLCETLGLIPGPGGFVQGDNVRHLPIDTNRVGIWAVGPAKGPCSLAEGLEEARAAVLAAQQLLNSGDGTLEPPIALDKKKCTICLTCYRLCPHRAISYLKRRPVFSGLACKACGICAAECPMDALQLKEFTDGDMGEEIQKATGSPVETEGSPLVLAFCCQNSAMEAARLASLRGIALPSGLRMVKVPCAGKVDPAQLLDAFRAGADGVMVVGCHGESCQSMRGSDLAGWRVEAMQEALEEAGLEPDRLFFGTAAPGEAAEFAAMARNMDNRLRERGVRPLEKARKAA